ncbi:hypothetical protein QGN23_00575 [Chryseobacterium gotjawalense]|uniref:Uncharacterized protein n=1 Tax=Chryseobacterium gotjawalense TaxID=3042315 RepID=A0ABY8RF45_9FLAO|nr:hypothetical protein [Chryseobacterium sp. wdc7]WHF51788.1 hypothetical protein QGN23_00575 [Chryseobacterium sp. wdc7]
MNYLVSISLSFLLTLCCKSNHTNYSVLHLCKHRSIREASMEHPIFNQELLFARLFLLFTWLSLLGSLYLHLALFTFYLALQIALGESKTQMMKKRNTSPLKTNPLKSFDMNVNVALSIVEIIKINLHDEFY